MKKCLNLLQVLILLSLLSSCGKEAQKNAEELKVIKGNWGHLVEEGVMTETKNGETKSYNVLIPIKNKNGSMLINKKPGETVTVCLSKQDEKKYPGIAEEVKAAVNIWGHYIGRYFPVKIVRIDFPEINSLDPIAALNVVRPLCGTGQIDFVFGFHTLKKASGKDSFDFFTGDPKKYIAKNNPQNQPAGEGASLFFDGADPHRLIFLQDFSATKKGTWIPLSKYQGQVMDEQEILDMLIKRDERFIRSNNQENITLKSIIHEVGHAWGMCDQYPLATVHATNCDPRNSLLDKNKKIVIDQKSIMGGNTLEQILYLSNDDITGIQKLASRSDIYNNTRFNVENFVSDYGNPVIKNPIEALKVWSIQIQDDAFILSTAMYIHKKYDMVVEAFSTDGKTSYGKTVYSGMSPTKGKSTVFGNGKIPEKSQVIIKISVSVGEGENEKRIFKIIYNS